MRPSEANGCLGLKLPAAGGCMRSGGKDPSRQKQRGMGAEPSALGNFYNFSTKISHCSSPLFHPYSTYFRNGGGL